MAPYDLFFAISMPTIIAAAFIIFSICIFVIISGDEMSYPEAIFYCVAAISTAAVIIVFFWSLK